MRSLCPQLERSPCPSQLEKTHAQLQRPSAAKNDKEIKNRESGVRRREESSVSKSRNNLFNIDIHVLNFAVKKE